MTRTYKVSMRYPDGTTMFMGTMVAEEITDVPQNQQPMRRSQPTNNQVGSDGERMSDPQKRYLFRLLAAQGVEGKKAEEHLKDYFQVSRLGDIPKAAASEYIDQLVKDRGNGQGT